MDHVSPQDYDDQLASDADSDNEVKNESAPSSPSTAAAGGPSKGSGNVKSNAHLQKRRRVTRACDECRRKKIKCDGKQPCTHCTVYSYGKFGLREEKI